MEVSLWRDLVCSISSFFCLSSHDCFGLQPERKIYQTTEEILKLLNPMVESIGHINLASNDVVGMAVEQLVQYINEWRELFENWHPLTSRVHRALRAELLTTRIQNSIVEVVRLLNDSCQYLPARLNLPSFEHFIQEENSISFRMQSIATAEVTQKPLERFENVSHWLGFSSNMEMLIEIVALEKLMNAKQSENRSELDYIHQLIALLVRKHCHLFMLKRYHNDVLIPADYFCPLSLNLMEDPVIVASGRTYERAYIRKWLEMGLTVCPITRQVLVHTSMIPNYTCRALISNWCETKKVELSHVMNSINEPFDLLCPSGGLSKRDGEVSNSIENLKSDSVENQRKATAKLLVFANKNMEKRKIIADYGGIRLLVNLLHSIDPEVQENSVTTLLYLAVDHDNKTAIANSDAIGPLIHVLRTGTSEAQESSAATLFCLSVIHENKARIGRWGAIGPLVQLLKNGTPRGRNNAVIALFNLSIAHDNRARIVQAGGVELLVDLINPAVDMVDKAVGALESLSRIPEGRDAISKAGGIPLLVEVVELGSARAKENAASTLLRLCVNNSRSCRMVLEEGCEPPLVAMALSGTPRAREKAVALLHHLRSQRTLL